nr:PREDICTED: thioredoxin domain-containing protein 3 homolog [Latimeria chalumnae]|eukprot:XP_005999168.1 PREDICTED: thioredoxin domain-containing protein 3 homolog [Latimeria chalumnae]
MASKKKEIALQVSVNNQEQWEEMLNAKGLKVVDIYQAWCGPCKAVLSLFRKLKNEIGDDFLQFAVAEADSIDALEKYRGKCEPTFLFYGGEELVAVVRGANAPLLQKTIQEQLAAEKQVQEQGADRQVTKDELLLEGKDETLADKENIEEDDLARTRKCTRERTGQHFPLFTQSLKCEDNTEQSLSLPKSVLKENRLLRCQLEMSENQLYSTTLCILGLLDSVGQEDLISFMEQWMPKILKINVEDDAIYVEKVYRIPPQKDGNKQQKRTVTVKIQEAGFQILAHEEKTLTEAEACDFYQHKSGEPYFEELIQFMSSGPCHVLIISTPEGAEDVIPTWREFIGPTDVETAKQENPESLRALYGTEKVFNAVHGSDNTEQASRELAFFFPDFKPYFEPEPKHRSTEVERTLAIIRPELLAKKKDEILQKIQEAGFTIAMEKEMMLTEEQVKEFYKEHRGEDYFPALLQQMTSGPVLALALARKDAVAHWKYLLGPKRVAKAKEMVPESLRAQFAMESSSINDLHGSSDPNEAEKELSFFFPVEKTFATIKPDIKQDQKAEIIKKIEEGGFTISRMCEMLLSRDMAEEFYKEHKGKEFFEDLIDNMCQGPCLLMVLSKENAVQEWRKLMGPTDPAKAKEEDPDSLRAKFATSILKNAVHGASNSNHAIEKINFIFGDIFDNKENVFKGIEPNLEKVEPPENRDLPAVSGEGVPSGTVQSGSDISQKLVTDTPAPNTEEVSSEGVPSGTVQSVSEVSQKLVIDTPALNPEEVSSEGVPSEDQQLESDVSQKSNTDLPVPATEEVSSEGVPSEAQQLDSDVSQNPTTDIPVPATEEVSSVVDPSGSGVEESSAGIPSQF